MRSFGTPLDGFLSPFGTARGPFDPLSLFANGEDGALYVIDPDNCFTDTGGTTPAGEGDAVARINDTSGNGNHATQATSGARPTLEQTAGGVWYLDGDGIDDLLDTGSVFTTPNGFTLFAGLEGDDISGQRALSLGDFRYAFTASGTGNPWTWGATGADAISITGSNPATRQVIGGSVDFSGSSPFAIAGYVNSATAAATGTNSNANTNVTGLIAFDRQNPAGASNWQGGIYGAIVAVDRLLTASERQGVVGFVAEKSGVTV